MLADPSVLRTIDSHGLLGCNAGRPMLPTIACSDCIPADVPVAVRERDRAADGNVSPEELDIISRLVKLADPAVIFEFGTFDGRTTLNLAAHSRPDAKVFTLDLPRSALGATKLELAQHDRKYADKPTSGLRFRGTDVEGKITQLYGDSAAFDYTPYLGAVDFIFVDASHSYEYVLHDSRIARQLIRGEGVILWHDYAKSDVCWPGLVRALDELHAGEPFFGSLKHIKGTKLAIRWSGCRQSRRLGFLSRLAWGRGD